MRSRQTVALILTFLLTMTVIIWSAKPALVQPLEIAQQSTASAPELFTPVASPVGRGTITTAKDPTVVRQRFVKADFSLLTHTRGRALRLNLFDDVIYNVVIESTETPTGQKRGESASVKVGRVEGIPNSEVYLASRGQSLSGNVRLPDGKLYQIRAVSPGIQAVREINQAAFPPDHPPGSFKAIQKRSASRGSQNEAKTPFVSTPVVKVIVVYTPEALKAAGGTTDAMSTTIDLAQTETNTGYANSQIPGRVLVVAQGQVDYQESGKGETDLDRLANASGVSFNDIPALRQKYGADAVSLWVSKMEGCGLVVVNKNAADFRILAFNVVELDCATGNFSFAHELGHNLGVTHDPKNSKPDDGIFPYSHGYQAPDGAFRTIMAYKEGCAGHCPRVNYWSSSKRLFSGKPLGNPNESDNARTLSQTF